MTRVRLFTSRYSERDPRRAAEIEACLQKNLANAEINEVCLLVEGDDQSVPESSRLRVRRTSTRPRYEDFFLWINETANADDVSIIANSDIYFGSQLAVFHRWAMNDRSVFALSRWDDVAGASPVLNDRNDSQDSWIFTGKIDGVSGDFPVGVPRCDNRIVRELELGGYTVRNPSFSLQSFHLHAGKRSEYPVDNQTEFVPPPYGYVWPHNLWSLPATLSHNSRYPESRLHWRVDKRAIARVLKLHRATKILKLAAMPFRTSGI